MSYSTSSAKIWPEPCPRCGSVIKDVKRHIKNVHPEASYMRPEEPRPHPQAQKITIQHEDCEMGWHDIVTDDEWKTGRWGFRRHGWFIPVEVVDNQEKPTP